MNRTPIHHAGFCVLVLFLATHALAGPAGPTAVESGKFIILQGGKRIGTESYTHEIVGDQHLWSATVEIQTSGITINQSPRLVLDRVGRPVRMDLAFNTGDGDRSIEFVFGEKTYTMTPKGGPAQEIPLPSADPVILSNNVLHHTILLARRYDVKKGGKQEFAAIPDTKIVVEGRGEDDFRNAQETLKLRHLFVSLAGTIGMNLWLDATNRVIKIDIPLQRAEIFLEGFEDISPIVTPTSPPAGDFSAEDVEFRSGDQKMAGTLTLPRNSATPFPAVILITGSGPQNRDEDSEGVGGLKLGLFRHIAEKLSNNGIAVLRYDDRGVGKSEGNFATSGMQDFEDDARAAIGYLKTRHEIDPRRIGIVGHSEGAILGARIAAASTQLGAFVSLAGPAENGEKILRWQNEGSLSKLRLKPEERQRQAAAQQAFFESVRRAEGEVATVGGQQINVKWFKEFIKFEPLAAVKRIRCPVAILQGGKDVQVPPEDALLLEQVLEDAKHSDHVMMIFPTLSHTFTESSGDGLAEMADSQRKISPEVLDFILEFLKKRL